MIEIRELILKLNREYQITVLISSHMLDELSKLATCYGFIDRGQILKEISAEELEADCRKCMRVTVTDAKVLCRQLDAMQLEYRILSDFEADIYGDVAISKLSLALAGENCEITSIHEHGETLENYYINLVGSERYGDKND